MLKVNNLLQNGFQSGNFESGWMLIELYASVHEDSGILGHLGHPFGKYLGIPALSLGLQEFQKGTKGNFSGERSASLLSDAVAATY